MPTDYPSDTASNKQITPEVLWAQRSSATDADKNFVYLTISVPDVSPASMKLDMQPASLTFTGHSDTKKATYHVELKFYADIDPSASAVKHSERDVEIKLQKKELAEAYWPRLLKDSAKMHFLKTDFDKWVDEDEQDGVPDDDYMNQFGGGGMPGMGADGGFGGLDFSKLGGGAGGMGGMPDLSAMGGMGGMGGDDSDEDEDMPGLDGEDNDAEMEDAAAKPGSSKIEEVE